MSPKFVAIEGQDYVGKTTIATTIGEQTEFEYVKTPPSSFSPMKPFFDEISYINPMSRFFFYCSGVYASSQEIRSHLQLGQSVVADRYLQSLQYYHEALAKRELGPFLEQIDFIAPDLTLVLYANETSRVERSKKRGVKRSDYIIEQDERIMKIVSSKFHNSADGGKIQLVDTSQISVEEVIQECLKRMELV